MKKHISWAAGIAGVMLLLMSFGFVALEPAVVRGQATDTDDTEVTLVVDDGISITNNCANAVSMEDDSGNNMSQTVHVVQGECETTIASNSAGGYTLEIEASTDPAMQHTTTTDEFADYTEATTGTPDTWSVDSGVYEFGFSAVGGDVPDGTYDNGETDCDTATELAATSTLNYQGFDGTTKFQIASSSSPTSTDGTDTTMCFGAEQNGVFAPSGTYQATVTLTATNQ